MAPLFKIEDRFKLSSPKSARRGGVLLLLYPEQEKIFFPLMLRPSYPGVHSDQVSLPGGKVEKYDKNLIQTALRETHEEIGVDPSQVTILGELTDLYIPASNFLVRPVVGFARHSLSFQPDPKEVKKIIKATLIDLLDDSKMKQTQLELTNKLILDTPYFDVKQHVVWGATAMILSEFKTIVKEIF
ncbi:CoA pyrophosphatase [Cytophagales bacterium RKSG123]|nr:CoA pyrophosphatase [Xanthovirga aplysinae]